MHRLEPEQAATDITLHHPAQTQTPAQAREWAQAPAPHPAARIAAPFNAAETLLARALIRFFSRLGTGLDRLSVRLEGTLLRRILAVTIFPAILIATYFVGIALVESGISGRSLLGTILFYGILGLIFVPLERLMPFSRRWLSDPRGTATDIFIFFGNRAFATLIGGPLRLATILVLVHQLKPHIGQGLWPAGWPMLLQVILLIYAHDFLRYWYHRAMHEWPLMWRWHAVHHSAPRLYWFNAIRAHPLEGLVQSFYWAIPLAMLSAPLEVIFVAGLVGRSIGCFQHCNIDVKLGPLDHVFSSPHNHRYHHSRLISEGNSNYGSDIILWDQLFGTFHHRKGEIPSDRIGIGDMPNFPQNWVGLMLAPFAWRPDRWH